LKKERKEKFFRKLEVKLGVDLRTFSQERIEVESTGNGKTFSAKKSDRPGVNVMKLFTDVSYDFS
jgi:hypothetical protein